MRRASKKTEWYPGTRGFYLVAIFAVAMLYGVVLGLTTETGPGTWLANTIANTLPLGLVAMPMRILSRTQILAAPAPMQALVHPLAAIAFAAAWFFFLMISLGMVAGEGLMSFTVRPFLGPVALWQMMQGVTFYAVLALLAYVEVLRERTGPPVGAEPATSGTRRIFVKDGDEAVPLDPARVVQVTGAGDYSEIVTPAGKHLIRTTLNELEASLGASFLRVHRSRIVNIDRIERMEPAGGGRLSLHLSNGETVVSSRAGAKAIRERAV